MVDRYTKQKRQEWTPPSEHDDHVRAQLSQFACDF